VFRAFHGYHGAEEERMHEWRSERFCKSKRFTIKGVERLLLGEQAG